MRNREKLEKDTINKLNTTMIGAIAAIEEELGFIFGHDKDARTIEEEAMYKIFRDVRSRILGLGNEQIKRFMLDVKLYDIKGPYYKYDFVSPDYKHIKTKKEEQNKKETK